MEIRPAGGGLDLYREQGKLPPASVPDTIFSSALLLKTIEPAADPYLKITGD